MSDNWYSLYKIRETEESIGDKPYYHYFYTFILNKTAPPS